MIPDMKRKLTAAAAAGIIAMAAQAQSASDYLIFINPGHGGHESNDRNVVIEPYKQGDPNGYWESNSNLTKGLWLRTMLEAKGYRVKMSRTTNTEDDDLGLSTISRMANDAHADLFFSIHSNATGTSIRANFPLMLYRGWDNAADNPEDRVIAGILNKHLLENKATYWTDPSLNIRGDWDFYNWGYKVGLGVLRNLTVTGMLSEGSFHDYIPETYRLMSEDFCRLEAWHFRRAVDEYFKIPGESVGQIGGLVKDTRLPRSGDYIMHGDDKTATVQNATVELYDASGTLKATYVTDPVNINGFYAFRDVEPGKYHLKVTAPTHYPAEADIEVTADQITYRTLEMLRIRDTPPTVTGYAPLWHEGDEALLCNTPVVINFSWDMDTEATEKAFSIEPAVAGTFSWSDLNYTMTFTPDLPYDISTRYTVRLSTDAKHAGGMNLKEPLEFTFATTDRNFMEVIGQFPKEDDTMHYHGAAVEMRFDKLPESSSVGQQITCVDSKGNSVAFNLRGKKVSNTKSRFGFIRLPFSGDLTVGERYTVTFSGSIADKDGITIKAPVTVSFTAEDAGAPKTLPLYQPMTDAARFTFDESASSHVTSHKVAADTKQKLGDDPCVAFTYKFDETAGGEAVWTYSSEELPNPLPPGYLFGVHVYGDLSGNGLYLQLGNDVSTSYLHVTDLDFLGWRYIEVPATADAYGDLTGISIVQNEGPASVEGSFELGEILAQNPAGVADIEGAGISVYPNPASEYVIANADCVITSVELLSTGGVTVARADGNVLNVSETAAGTYLCRVNTAGSSIIKKIIIKH